MTGGSIEAVARRVRAEAVPGSPRGMCASATERLVIALRDEGFPARHAFGYFRTGTRHAEDIDNWIEHQFAVVGETAVDITADQFNDEIEGEPLPSVLICRVSPAGSKNVGIHWFDEGPVFIGEDGNRAER